MTKEEALTLLESGTAKDRYKAAYELMKLASKDDLKLLLNAHHFEKDAYVKKRLATLIKHVSNINIEPSISVPKIPVPSISLPNISVPNIPAPSISVPKIPVPSISLPNISVPNISVPSISVPNIPAPNFMFSRASSSESLIQKKIVLEGNNYYLRSPGVEWTASMLLHEIGSKLGLIALSASRELPNFESSKTKKYIKHLQAVFDAIEQLKSVNSAPKIEDFDLSELIEEVITFEVDALSLKVLRVGLRPLIVRGDRKFVELALCNGIRNAIEAIAGISKNSNVASDDSNENESIVVSWGVTDKDYWISIVDSGPGLLSNSNVFEVGKSTKPEHSGYGLQIAMQAMERLNGSLQLMPSSGGGAKYEMRWNRL